MAISYEQLLYVANDSVADFIQAGRWKIKIMKMSKNYPFDTLLEFKIV